MHQLLCQSVRIHASAVYAIQGGLGTVQDPPTARQNQMLQVHLGVKHNKPNASRVTPKSQESRLKGRSDHQNPQDNQT